jgi:hypothetical protein
MRNWRTITEITFKINIIYNQTAPDILVRWILAAIDGREIRKKNTIRRPRSGAGRGNHCRAGVQIIPEVRGAECLPCLFAPSRRRPKREPREKGPINGHIILDRSPDHTISGRFPSWVRLMRGVANERFLDSSIVVGAEVILTHHLSPAHVVFVPTPAAFFPR